MGSSLDVPGWTEKMTRHGNEAVNLKNFDLAMCSEFEVAPDRPRPDHYMPPQAAHRNLCVATKSRNMLIGDVFSMCPFLGGDAAP